MQYLSDHWFLSLCFALLGAVIVGFVIWFGYEFKKARRRSNVYEELLSPSGVFKPTVEAIRLFMPVILPEGSPQEFPRHLQTFIRNATPNKLANWVHEFLELREETDATVDAKRAITIASALYGFPIPGILLEVDERTAVLLSLFERSMRSMYVPRLKLSGERPATDIFTDQQLLIAKYYKPFLIVNKIMMSIAAEKSYPGFAFFVDYFRDNAKLVTPREFTDNEIRSMVTAYASLTKTCVPYEYINVDDLAKKMVVRFKGLRVVEPTPELLKT